VTTLIVAPLVAAFRAAAPDALFGTWPLFLSRALSAVRRGEMDLAIGAFDRIPAGLTASLLYEDDYCVLARQDHPQVRGRVDAETYRTIGHVFVGRPEPLSDEPALDLKLMHAAYGQLPTPEQVRTYAYVSQWETAMLMVASSDVLVDCPRSLARRFAPMLGLQALDPPYRPFRFEIKAVRRAGDSDAGLAWLLQQIEAAVG
jgi:DNA-binding transcriptional LysR family regulator